MKSSARESNDSLKVIRLHCRAGWPCDSRLPFRATRQRGHSTFYKSRMSPFCGRLSAAAFLRPPFCGRRFIGTEHSLLGLMQEREGAPLSKCRDPHFAKQSRRCSAGAAAPPDLQENRRSTLWQLVSPPGLSEDRHREKPVQNLLSTYTENCDSCSGLLVSDFVPNGTLTRSRRRNRCR
jgi:hypothetical protein